MSPEDSLELFPEPAQEPPAFDPRAPLAERMRPRSIDEVVGQLLTLAPLTLAPPAGGSRAPGWLLAGFLVFRLFDIWKPGPVRWAERRFRGGAGVMLDDVVAGILSAALMGAAALALAGRTA